MYIYVGMNLTMSSHQHWQGKINIVDEINVVEFQCNTLINVASVLDWHCSFFHQISIYKKKMIKSNEKLFPNHIFFFLEYLKSVPRYFNQYDYLTFFFADVFLRCWILN